MQIEHLVSWDASILNGIYCARAGTDEVRLALERLSGHISNPRKFKKASPLLRQLLKEGRVTRDHASLLFQVVYLTTTIIDGLRSVLLSVQRLAFLRGLLVRTHRVWCN